jgi:hypothetical protein
LPVLAITDTTLDELEDDSRSLEGAGEASNTWGQCYNFVNMLAEKVGGKRVSSDSEAPR